MFLSVPQGMTIVRGNSPRGNVISSWTDYGIVQSRRLSVGRLGIVWNRDEYTSVQPWHSDHWDQLPLPRLPFPPHNLVIIHGLVHFYKPCENPTVTSGDCANLWKWYQYRWNKFEDFPV